MNAKSDKTTPEGKKPGGGKKSSVTPPEAAAERSALSREVIVAAAFGIVDAEGLDALSMRRLGGVLGTDPMAVYHHLPNKAALFDAMATDLLEAVNPPPGDRGGFLDERLASILRAYRSALLAHPNALPLLARGGQLPAHHGAAALTRALADAGIAREQTSSAAAALVAYAVGATATGVDDEVFDIGTAALVRGIAGASGKSPKKGKPKVKAKKKDGKKGH